MFGNLIDGINSGATKLANALYPSDPNIGGYVDPATTESARNNALITLGLGIMRAPYSMTGLGSGLLDAYQGSQNVYQGAMDKAFQHTLIKRELDQQGEDRAHKLALDELALKKGQLELKQSERADRTQAATVAQRVLKGLSTASDPTSYLGLIQNDPDVKDAFQTLGIQTPYVGPLAQPGNLDQFRQQLTTAASAAPPPAPIKLSQGDVLLDPNNPSGPPLASAAPKGDFSIEKGVSVGNNQVQDFLIDHRTGQKTPASPPYTSTGQQRLNNTSSNLADWDPDSINFAAEKYRLTGQLPPLGQGSGAVKAQIIKKASENAAAAGDSATAAVFRQQAVKANGQAMDQLTKQVAATKAYSDNLEKNLASLETQVGKIDATGVPILNRAFTAFKNKVSGDKDTAKFVAYLQDVEAEFAKLKSGALGNAPLSDSQMKEAHDLMLNAFSQGGFAGLKEAIQQTARNKMESYGGTLSALQAGNVIQTPTKTSAPAGADGKPLW